MSEEKNDLRAKETLYVTVHARPGSSEPISPSIVTLTDAVGKVVWHCDDLAAGATLLIHFQEDPRGPFAFLRFVGKRVVGYGNRGPASTSWTYHYEAKIEIGGAVISVGGGTVQNTAAQPLTPTDPPIGPPWDNP
jgi:hypothetical protein